jgi:hypothetical protein
VAQVYVGSGPTLRGVQQAVRALRGFVRVPLAPGQTSRETVHLDARSFQYWNEVTQSWTTAHGMREIWIGDADAPGSLPLRVSVGIYGFRGFGFERVKISFESWTGCESSWHGSCGIQRKYCSQRRVGVRDPAQPAIYSVIQVACGQPQQRQNG